MHGLGIALMACGFILVVWFGILKNFDEPQGKDLLLSITGIVSYFVGLCVYLGA